MRLPQSGLYSCLASQYVYWAVCTSFVLRLTLVRHALLPVLIIRSLLSNLNVRGQKKTWMGIWYMKERSGIGSSKTVTPRGNGTMKVR